MSQPVHPVGANRLMHRANAVALNGSVMSFEHPQCGHRSSHDFQKGPVTKRVSVLLLKRFLRYWGPEGGGVNSPCPKCWKKVKGGWVRREMKT